MGILQLGLSAARSEQLSARRGGERLAGALGVQLGAFLMMLGTSWDIQWHARIGRDSFWIPPHLVLYAGLGLVMLSLGLLVLRETIWPAPGAITILGLRGSLGAIVSAAGVVVMLLGAPFDDWWHRMFGIDVTIWSPPHLLLIAGGALIGVGVAVSYGVELRAGRLSAAQRRYAWAALALGYGQLVGPFALAIQPAISWSFLSSYASSPFLYPLLAALALPTVFGMARAATGWRWAATGSALVAFALAIVSLLFDVAAFRAIMPEGLPTQGSGILEKMGLSMARYESPWMLFFPLLQLPPALALDVLAGTERRLSWRVAAGALGWATLLLAESLLVWTCYQDGLPLGGALARLPLMTLAALAALLIGGWVGRAGRVRSEDGGARS